MKFNYKSLPYILLCYSHYTHQFENFDMRGLKFQKYSNGSGIIPYDMGRSLSREPRGSNFVNGKLRIVHFCQFLGRKLLNPFWMKVGPKERPELLNLLLKLHKTAWNIRLIQLWISRFSWWHKKIDVLRSLKLKVNRSEGIPDAVNSIIEIGSKRKLLIGIKNFFYGHFRSSRTDL